jgi:hypothetical protein
LPDGSSILLIGLTYLPAPTALQMAARMVALVASRKAGCAEGYSG